MFLFFVDFLFIFTTAVGSTGTENENKKRKKKRVINNNKNGGKTERNETERRRKKKNSVPRPVELFQTMNSRESEMGNRKATLEERKRRRGRSPFFV